jgi:hypothetical protein
VWSPCAVLQARLVIAIYVSNMNICVSNMMVWWLVPFGCSLLQRARQPDAVVLPGSST